MAVILYNYSRFMELTINEHRWAGFADANDIAPSAMPAVSTLTNAGVFDIMAGSNFRPNITASRAQAAQVFLNFARFVAN